MNQSIPAEIVLTEKPGEEIVVKKEPEESDFISLLQSNLAEGVRRRDAINAIANNLITTKAFKCLICERVFKKKQNVRSHIEAVHIKNKILVCDICDKGYQRKPYLRRHIEKYHIQHPERLCRTKKPKQSKVNNKNIEPQRSKIIQNSKKTKGFPCLKCKKVFTQNTNRKTHYKAVHLKIKRFACDFCSKTFYQKMQVEQHLMSIHLDPISNKSIFDKNRPFKCKFRGCEKYYRSQGGLYLHHQHHKGTTSSLLQGMEAIDLLDGSIS